MDGNTEKIKRKGRGNEIEKQYGKNYQVDERVEIHAEVVLRELQVEMKQKEAVVWRCCDIA